MKQLGMYLLAIPELQLRMEYSTAKLGWILSAALSGLGGKPYQGTLKDHLSPWAQSTELPNLTREEAEGVRKALVLRLLSQDDLDHLEALNLGHTECKKWGV